MCSSFFFLSVQSNDLDPENPAEVTSCGVDLLLSWLGFASFVFFFFFFIFTVITSDTARVNGSEILHVCLCCSYDPNDV